MGRSELGGIPLLSSREMIPMLVLTGIPHHALKPMDNTMQVTEKEIEEALLLLNEAHQQLLDAGHYGVDLLVFRAIQLLRDCPPHHFKNINSPDLSLQSYHPAGA